MRFKASIQNISTFTKLTASLSSLGKEAWIRLDDEHVRFTVIPEQGSQVWAVLSRDAIFETYTIESAAQSNVINLRVPLAHLHRALRSALTASSASLRLTKKDNIPLLSLTITTNSLSSRAASIPTTYKNTAASDQSGDATTLGIDGREEYDEFAEPSARDGDPGYFMGGSDRETTITQSIPVVVLAAITVANIHEPKCRDPDVHIILPSLIQLKAISERFTKLALAPSSTLPTTRRYQASENENQNDAPMGSHSRLILAANGHGGLKIGVETPNLKIESKWEGLTNPELDPGHVEGGEEAVREHASTKMREVGGWATVRVEGRDWGRVLGVGRLGGRVIACFCHDHALILYVYLTNTDSEDSVLTYYIASYSA